MSLNDLDLNVSKPLWSIPAQPVFKLVGTDETTFQLVDSDENELNYRFVATCWSENWWSFPDIDYLFETSSYQDRLQRCWLQSYVGDFLMMIVLRCINKNRLQPSSTSMWPQYRCRLSLTDFLSQLDGYRWLKFYCKLRPKILENEWFNRVMLLIVAISVIFTALWPSSNGNQSVKSDKVRCDFINKYWRTDKCQKWYLVPNLNGTFPGTIINISIDGSKYYFRQH